ncbi:hypothetical protein NMY22_g5919 [Coprinellus aureogranulatus]|nr:hypothetical protein NMY22_g5919 [Coprinellus aureogranulatus]
MLSRSAPRSFMRICASLTEAAIPGQSHRAREPRELRRGGDDQRRQTDPDALPIASNCASTVVKPAEAPDAIFWGSSSSWRASECREGEVSAMSFEEQEEGEPYSFFLVTTRREGIVASGDRTSLRCLGASGSHERSKLSFSASSRTYPRIQTWLPLVQLYQCLISRQDLRATYLSSFARARPETGVYGPKARVSSTLILIPRWLRVNARATVRLPGINQDSPLSRLLLYIRPTFACCW